MNKPMVLVIHGMGTHAPGNTKAQIAKGINETAKHFGLQNFKFEDQVEFFQFNYSEFLDEIRMKDAEQAGAIMNHITMLQGHGLGEKAVQKLTGLFAGLDQDKFFNTHWMDVIYYGLMFWGEKIRVDLATKINALIREQLKYNRKLHIIPHSLGTAVLHDTLAKLYRKDPDLSAKAPQLDVDSYKLDSVWMVANVSRMVNLLNDIADPNHSLVTSGPHGCTRLMYNVRNEFDPFTWFKRYDRMIDDGQQVSIKTIRELNTHDLTEYMAAPETCDLILQNILNITVSDEQYKEGVKKHRETSINKPYEEIKDSLAVLQNQPDLSDGVDALMQLISAAGDFEDKIKSMVNNF